MHYTLHQLRVFYKVAEHQSITKASEELNLTQPAVSIQLKKLQDQFDIPLTEVVGRQLYVTDFGEELVSSVEKILNEVDAIDFKLMAFKNQLAGRLRISVASTGKYVMPYFLSEFMSEHKGVDLIMDVTNKTRVVESLENNEVDFALVSVIPDHFKVYSEELLTNKLFLIGSPKIIPDGKYLKKKLFEEYPLLFREEGSATRAAMENFIQKNKLPVLKSMRFTSNEALKQAAISGLGYSVMPLIGIKNALKIDDLRIIPWKGLPIITQWNLIWMKSKKLSPVAEAYLEYLRAEKTRIVNEVFDWYEKY